MASKPIALSVLIVAALAASAYGQTLYRYVDANGRVIYSDQPPPASARQVQSKQLTENVIDTDPAPLAAREAAERFPVTLYTFDCDICREAQAMLAKRGVPFATVSVSDEKGLARLKALTGKQSAPVLQVGDKQVLQGYNEDAWQAALDQAGYPKTAPAARPQSARATPTPAPVAAAPAEDSDDKTPPARGGDYPK